MTLRLVMVVLGAAATVAALALGRPDSFAVTMPSALLIFVVAAGALAADAVPLRRVPLACSVLTLACAVAMVLRSEWQAGLAAAVVALQLLALAWPAVAARRQAAAATAG